MSILQPNPKLSKFLPMTKSLKNLSADLLLLSDEKNQIDDSFVRKLTQTVNKAFIPYNDVRLASEKSFNDLIRYRLSLRGFEWKTE